MKKNKILIILILVLALLIITGCTKNTAVDEESSPQLTDCQVFGECNGGENDQYITAVLCFDSDVKVNDTLSDELRIVIGDNRIAAEKINISQTDSHTIEIKMSVTQVNDGVMEISPVKDDALQGLTDKTGKYAVKDFSIKKLIPSGVSIEAEETSMQGESAHAKIKLLTCANHRSITWVQLYVDGVLVKPDDENAAYIMDDAVGVHEHDFLWATAESEAQSMAEAINNYYGSKFTADASGDEISINAVDGTLTGTLEVRIYDY